MGRCSDDSGPLRWGRLFEGPEETPPTRYVSFISVEGHDHSSGLAKDVSTGDEAENP